MIDFQLLEDTIKGDRRAQFQLYKRCSSVLMSVCSRYRPTESEAVAMMNEGFLKILQNLKKYSTDVPFEAWIRRIMINTLIDDFRKNRKVSELMESHDFTDTSSHEEFVDFNTADLQFDAGQLEAMIQTLPPVSLKVFNLYAIDGYSHSEIGAMLGISEGTSKWHLSFARQRLRELLVKQGAGYFAMAKK